MDKKSFPPIKATKEVRTIARKKLLKFLEKELDRLGKIDPDDFFECKKQEFRADGFNNVDSIVLAAELLSKVTRTRKSFEEQIASIKKLISIEKHRTEA